MSADNKEKQNTNTFGLKSLFGWLIGIVATIAGIGFITEGAVVSGLATLVIPFFSIPMLADKWQSNYNFSLSTGMTALTVFGLFVVIGIAAPQNMVATENPDSNNAQVVDQQNSPEPEEKEQSNTSTSTEDLPQETAGSVIAGFEDNQIAAKEKYSNGVVITGTVNSVGEDILANPYVTIYTTNEFETVQAMMPDVPPEELTSINSGQVLRVRCKSVSSSMGSPLARECTIAQ